MTDSYKSDQHRSPKFGGGAGIIRCKFPLTHPSNIFRSFSSEFSPLQPFDMAEYRNGRGNGARRSPRGWPPQTPTSPTRRPNNWRFTTSFSPYLRPTTRTAATPRNTRATWCGSRWCCHRRVPPTAKWPLPRPSRWNRNDAGCGSSSPPTSHRASRGWWNSRRGCRAFATWDRTIN